MRSNSPKKKNYIVPLDDVLISGNARVLDIGVGMGLWIIEMASDFPESTFIGIDKDKTFPTTAIPSNAEFKIVDATKPWPFKDDEFDLIGQRMLFSDYKATDWPFVLKETFRCLKPGGWIQFAETQVYTSRASDKCIKLCNWVIDLINLQGCNALIYRDLPRLLYETGFQEIEEFIISIPFGSWGGAVGTLLKDDGGAWGDNFKQATVNLLGVKPEEYDEMWKAMMTDCETYKSYTNFSVFIAQKPENPQ